MNGSSATGYQNWKSDEPTAHEPAERCARMNYQDGMWYDFDCNKGFYYICEVEIIPGKCWHTRTRKHTHAPIVHCVNIRTRIGVQSNSTTCTRKPSYGSMYKIR